MFKKALKKSLIVTLSLLVMLPMVYQLLLVGTAHAEEVTTDTSTTPSGTTNAADTQRSMLKFFRDSNAGLNVKQTSQSEAMVYGVFLSNFFTPGKTKLKDLSKENGAELADKVSTKFFGSNGNAAVVGELNDVLYRGITSVMSSNKKNFALKTSSTTVAAMTGKDLLSKILSTSDTKVYLNSNVVMDMKNQSTQSAFQLLFGYSPDLMLGSNGWMLNATGLYMDGLGNIWASYKEGANEVDVDNYVLVMPAAINPVTFSPTGDPSTGTGIKLPISNVFAMGATVGVKENYSQGRNPFTPYYNMKTMFTAGDGVSKRNINNLVSLVGLESWNKATSLGLGESDSIIRNGLAGFDMKTVTSFLDKGASNESYDEKQGRVFITTDITNITSTNYFMNTALASKEQDRLKLHNYFMSSRILQMSTLEDRMYYFDLGGEGSFSGDDPGPLVREQRFFTKKTDTGSYTFYNDAQFSSPFNAFLKDFLAASDTQKDTLLKNFIKDYGSKKDIDTSKDSFKALKSFLTTGYFTPDKSAIKTSTVDDALGLLGSNLALGLLPLVSSADESKIVDTEWWSFWNSDKYYPTGYMIGFDDNDIVRSTTSKGSGMRKPASLYKSLKKDGKLDAKAQSSIAYVFYNSMIYRVFSMNKSFTSSLTSSPDGELDAKVAGFKGDFKVESALADGVNSYPGIYWSYMVTLLGITADAEGNFNSAGMGFSNKNLPSMTLDVSGSDIDLNSVFSNSGVVSSEATTMEGKQKDIIDKVYGLLSDGPNSYRDRLTKSTQDSYIIQTHKSIVGSWANDNLGVSAGGNQSYASIVGYINTPTLTDLPLTAWLLNDYVYIYLVLMLICLIIIVLMVITGSRSVRSGVAIFLITGFVLLLPQYAVNSVVGVTNKISDKIFSDRFNYWAITQHQQSVTNLESARNSGDELDYIIANNMDMAKNSYSSDVGVRVKWMAPKRDDVFNSLFSRDKSIQGLDSDLTVFRWLFNSYFNQEEYVFNDPLATYLYRPYSSIAKEAKDSYANMSTLDVDKSDVVDRIDVRQDGVPFIPEYRFDSMLVNNKTDDRVEYTDDMLALIDNVKRYAGDGGVAPDSYRYWAIMQPEVTKALFRTDYDSADAGIAGDVDGSEYTAFTLATESPFYYFYNALKSNYGSDGASFKNALLSKSNFRVSNDNVNVDGKLRDFLDMEGLFTYVIPYLAQGNDYVHGWTRMYGTDVDAFDFTDVDIDSDPNATQEMKDQFLASKNKKENMKNVWKLYSPWVDAMYAGNVLNQKVKVADKRNTVMDGASPSSYRDVGRDMVFSEADMRSKSYTKDALSDVEYNIQQVLEKTYKDLMYLTNYYDFDDETLITAASMMATFNFNREFSVTNPVTGGSQLYPQGFELKNFNYDAFMRLMLLNATGEPLMADKDLYVRVIDKTSLPTGILLIVDDVMAVYVIPTLKIIVLLSLLFLCFAVVFGGVLSPPEKLTSSLWRFLGLPMVLFILATVAFAWVVSLLMGEGLTGYVGGRAPSLGVSDPTTMLLLLLVADCVYVTLLVIVFWQLFKGLKSSVLGTVFVAQAVVGSALKNVAGSLTSAARNMRNRAISRSRHREIVDAIESSNGFGGGGSSSNERSLDSINYGGALGSSDAYSSSGNYDMDELNRLSGSSSNVGSLDSGDNLTSGVVVSRTLGHKMVNMKHNLYRVGDVTNRVLSPNTAKSVGNAIASTPTNVARSAQKRVWDATDRVREYRNEISAYDLQRSADRVSRLPVNSGRVKRASADYMGKKLLNNIDRVEQAAKLASRREYTPVKRMEYKGLTGESVSPKDSN